ncbi:protein FAM50B [Cryptococcus wingfieldii CBS 7118]|uniref:Protein FAM50B n=1 Tax=Cryptococcus wingfieldii CBS 7118 TaxID=1295528 RepID=A0A1E3JIW0_9TREE|nr:protein FAM50B [Cryptococcus wingfieldii CBS 7118]ODO00839.1 protein FAM50B [Cryptococcus wingfieldii CBS 7118]
MSGPPEESLRTLVLTKQREKEAAEIQRQKEAITKDSQRDHTVDRFVGVTENLDERLIKTTVGLVSLSEFQKTKSDLEEAQRKLAAQVKTDKPNSNQKVRKAKKKNRSKLSFDDEGEDDSGLAEFSVDKRGEPDQNPKKKSFKNPGVDTSFLPDRNRELEEAQERERLRKEWLAQQEKTKNETIEITYSFWDGSGHRKSVECKKGDDIASFLNKCRQQFPELRGTSVENLMYIKEDLIIPHHYTFYDFIINKARGKSGPLFNFDVHDDVRMVSDATVEKDEASHLLSGIPNETDNSTSLMLERWLNDRGITGINTFFQLPDGRYTIQTKSTVHM